MTQTKGGGNREGKNKKDKGKKGSTGGDKGNDRKPKPRRGNPDDDDTNDNDSDQDPDDTDDQEPWQRPRPTKCRKRFKEADEIEIDRFPRDVASYEAWVGPVVSKVTAAGYDEDLAFDWIIKVCEGAITFAGFRETGDEKSLEPQVASSFAEPHDLRECQTQPCTCGLHPFQIRRAHERNTFKANRRATTPTCNQNVPRGQTRTTSHI